MKQALFPYLFLAFLALSATGCPVEGLDGSGDGDGGDDAPQLTASHPGWQSACCLDCHDSSGHRAGYDPSECSDCHGTNGAPAGHGSAASCLTCHGSGVDEAPVVHACDAGDYPDPSSCESCHLAGGGGGGGGEEEDD
jgi:hypothetical protein